MRKPPEMTAVKICGLTTPETITAAIDEGTDYIGFVFYPEIEVAAYLASYVPNRVKIVGLFVDPDNDLLKNVRQQVRLDMVQLHGEETPERVENIRQSLSLPVMKSIPIKDKDSLSLINKYKNTADWLLLDAPPTNLPGGTGKSFNWDILKEADFPLLWMLAGGLTPDNVAEAIRLLKPDAVDVSSGVEKERGVKDAEKIRRFILNAKTGS
jgi:phosphoribosylanthranilate isomerase